MRALYCFLFKHRFRSSKGANGLTVCKICQRCHRVLVRDYFNGWQRASQSEATYMLEKYATRGE